MYVWYVYLPTFPIKIYQMYVNIPYMDPQGLLGNRMEACQNSIRHEGMLMFKELQNQHGKSEESHLHI